MTAWKGCSRAAGREGGHWYARKTFGTKPSFSRQFAYRAWISGESWLSSPAGKWLMRDMPRAYRDIRAEVRNVGGQVRNAWGQVRNERGQARIMRARPRCCS